MEGTVDCEAIGNILYLPMESLDYPPFLYMHFPLEKEVPFLCWNTKGVFIQCIDIKPYIQARM